MNETVWEKRSITSNIAFQLSLYFDTSEWFWLRLQDNYDLEQVHMQQEEHLKNLIKLFKSLTDLPSL